MTDYKNVFASYNIINSDNSQLNYDIIDPVQYYRQYEEDITSDTPEIEEQNNLTQNSIQNTRRSPKKQYDHTISFEQLLQNIGLGNKVKITSSYREGAVTPNGTPSWHSQKDEYGYSKAYDIVPINGFSFMQLQQALKSSEEARNWFEKRGYGLLDETTQAMLARTRGTGPHYHIGPDKSALENWGKILSARKGIKFEADNTRTEIDTIKHTKSLPKEIQELIKEVELQNKQGVISDADKAEFYSRLQQIYNENGLVGKGIQGYQVNINPNTEAGQTAIQSNINLSKDLYKAGAEALLSEAAFGGVEAIWKYLTEPIIAGRGAESVVLTSRISPYVKGITTKSIEEIEDLNKIKGFLHREIIGTTPNGLAKYRAKKIKPYSEKDSNKVLQNINSQILKDNPSLREFRVEGMSPNELAYETRKGTILNDIWKSNIGKEFGKGDVIFDATILPKDDFLIMVSKKGGKFRKFGKRF